MTETFYEVLGVPEDATTDEIESAYRDRLKETHPDVSDDEDAGQATKDLIEARDVLVDEDERARYDRLGHAAYVSDDPTAAASAASETTTDESETGDTATTGGGGNRTGSRAGRERRASKRVREERRRAREGRQQRRESTAEESDSDATESTNGATTSADGAATGARDSQGRTTRTTQSGATTGAGTAETTNTYSVRQDIDRTRSFGRVVPKGHELTLLGIFFPLYPVLTFCALLPDFPLFVNVILGGATLLMIGYLQSMPRVAVPLFGGWSGISIVGLGLFGIGYFSLAGVLVLTATFLPFGFSLLTASMLRF